MYNCLSFHLSEIDYVLNSVKELENKKIINLKVNIEKEPLIEKFKKKFELSEVIASEEFTKCKSEYENFFLDKDIIEYLEQNFNVIFEIFNRYDLAKQSFSFHKKKTHIFNLASQIINIYKSKKINLVIFYQSPHHIDTYISYLIAKYFNFKILIFKQFSFLGENRLCIDSGLRIFFEDLDNELKELDEKHSRKVSDNYINELLFKTLKEPDYIKKSYFKYGNKIERNNFFYYLYLDIKNYFFKNSLLKSTTKSYYWYKDDFFENISPPININFIKINFFLRTKIFIMKLYYKIISQKQLPSNYISFFPNYKPEASTIPEAGSYSNINLILKNLFSILPDNIKIVYKEHKTTFDYSRESFTFKDINFYKYLKKKYKNLIFYDYDNKNDNLIENSIFVTTLTSNIAWESYLKNKNVVIAKGCWFDRFDGFFYHENINQKIDYLIKNKVVKNDIDMFKNYCAFLFKNSFNKFKINEKEKEIILTNLIKKLS